MHSTTALLLSASTCLVQAQTSASKETFRRRSSASRDILPTLPTTSISIPFPLITIGRDVLPTLTIDVLPTLTTTLNISMATTSISIPVPSITMAVQDFPTLTKTSINIPFPSVTLAAQAVPALTTTSISIPFPSIHPPSARSILPTLSTTSISIPFPSFTHSVRDILPTATSSINIALPTLLPPVIPNHRRPSSRQDVSEECIAFLNESENFSDFIAQAHDVPTPPYYRRVFHNKRGIVYGFRRVGEQEVDSYDPHECAFGCNDTPGCNGFNIYAEWAVNVTLGTSCPPVTAAVRCSFWGEPLSLSKATVFDHADGSMRHHYERSSAYLRGLPASLVPYVEQIGGFDPVSGPQPDEGSSSDTDSDSDEESSANGRASMRLAGLTVASAMALVALGAMAGL